MVVVVGVVVVVIVVVVVVVCVNQEVFNLVEDWAVLFVDVFLDVFWMFFGFLLCVCLR